MTTGMAETLRRRMALQTRMSGRGREDLAASHAFHRRMSRENGSGLPTVILRKSA